MSSPFLFALCLPVLQAPAPAPPSTTASALPAPRLDGRRILEDVKTLASPAFQGRRPGTEGHRKAQALIEARLKSLGLPKLGASYRRPYQAPRAGANFAAVVPGTEKPSACIFVTAHYDHLGIRQGRLYPGADDNASGTAAVLALAAHFKAHPPRHTLVFAFFDDEERGLLGSQAFVAAAPWKPLRPLLDLNADMLSRSGPGELWISGLRNHTTLRGPLEALAGEVPVQLRFGHDTPKVPKPDEDWSDESDQASFNRAGIPGLYIGVEDHADYHQPTDTFARIQPDFYLRACETLLKIVERVDGLELEDLLQRGRVP